MNSSTDKNFDEQLDQLLTASVRSGAEPEGFSVVRMPPRPQFNGVLAGGAVAVMALLGGVMYLLVTGQLSASAQSVIPGGELWMLLSDSLIVGAESLSSTTFLLYAAVIMAGVYLFAANRIIRLFRLH